MNQSQERALILSLAKNICKEKLEKSNLRVNNQSDKLFEMNDSNSTARSRAVMRASFSTDCEERVRWENRVDEIDKWLGELNQFRK
jgi:hypothetical protein